MLRRHIVVWLASATATMVVSVAGAQTYPNRPIRIVTAEPAGGGDFVARLLAQELTTSLRQQVIVENRGGASGSIAAQIVAKAAPDGHTLLLYSGTFWTYPLLQRTPYDPVRDFEPITLTVSSPNILVTHPAVPATSVNDLIALARARPGELNYASGGSGASSHLAAALFTSLARINLVHVPYKSSGQGVVALMGGHVQLMFATAASVTPHIKSGALRGLAVTSAKPSALAPGLPAVSASVPGYESVLMYPMFAPAKTPAAVLRRLNDELVRILDRQDMKDKFIAAGVEPVGSSANQLSAIMKSEMARLGKVIKDSGIRID